MQSTVNSYLRHSHKWRYALHLGKFQYVVTKQRDTSGLSLSLAHVHTPHATPLIIKPQNEAKYLVALFDKHLSGLPAMRDMESAMSQSLRLLQEVRKHLGRPWALKVQSQQVEKKSMYCVECCWQKPQQMQKLDSSMTIRGLKASLGVEKRENREFVLYEVPHLWASSQFTQAQVRMYLKLSWYGTALQKHLLHAASLDTAHPKLQLFYENVKQGLWAMGRNIKHIKTMSAPKPWRRKLLMKHMRLSLLKRQATLLKDRLPSLGVETSTHSGRGSLSLFSKVCLPIQQRDTRVLHYNEMARFKKLPKGGPAMAVRKIRAGHSVAKKETAKYSARGNATTSVACICGHTVQDHEHLILECPSTETRRQAVLAGIHAKAETDLQLKLSTLYMTPESLLLASLGGPISTDHPGGKASTALIACAAPLWQKSFEDLLR